MFSVLIQTLGCKLNQLESEAITDAFLRCGFSIYDKNTQTKEPPVIVINTCTVTSKADQKARRFIRKALRDYPFSSVFVTGCYANLDKTAIEELDNLKSGRLFVMKNSEILDLPALLKERKQGTGNISDKEKSFIPSPQASMQSFSILEKNFQFAPQQFSAHTRGSLKIQDGCNKTCTYCRIRLARGPSISLDSKTVLERLFILEQSHAEVVLTGVNICQYQDKAAKNLVELLDYLLNKTKNICIRLSSLEPENIDENFAKILSHPRIRPHFHLSIQSFSKNILEKMGRKYTPEVIERAITLLRSAKEDPFIACDIITGFPGETHEEFEKTYEMCKKSSFAWIHVFPYSKRPGTPAFLLKETVPEKEVSKRVEILTSLAWQGRNEYVKRWIGKEVEVVVENGGGKFHQGKYYQGKFYQGTSENYLKVLVQYDGEAPIQGSVARCLLSSVDVQGDYDVICSPPKQQHR